MKFLLKSGKPRNLPYTAATIILLAGFLVSGVFLYRNVYKAMSLSIKAVGSPQATSSSPIDLKSFNKVVGGVEEKMKEVDMDDMEDPFK